MDSKRYRIAIQFYLLKSGKWDGPKEAAESLLTLIVAELNSGDKPVDYTTGDTFELIFERDSSNRIEALTWAKGIQDSALKLWSEQSKDTKISPREIKIDEIKPAEAS
jgi:hypothetical protein